MVTFYENLKPTSFKYGTEGNLIFETESGDLIIRNTPKRFITCDISFSFDKEEYDQFLYFFNEEINKGLDIFLANFALEEEPQEYSIISDINQSFNDTKFEVSFRLAKIQQRCDDIDVRLIKAFKEAINLLTLDNIGVDNTIPCSHLNLKLIEAVKYAIDNLTINQNEDGDFVSDEELEPCSVTNILLINSLKDAIELLSYVPEAPTDDLVPCSILNQNLIEAVNYAISLLVEEEVYDCSLIQEIVAVELKEIELLNNELVIEAYDCSLIEQIVNVQDNELSLLEVI